MVKGLSTSAILVWCFFKLSCSMAFAQKLSLGSTLYTQDSFNKFLNNSFWYFQNRPLLTLPDGKPTAFFCRLEQHWNPTNKRLLVFRLGSLDYANSLEYSSRVHYFPVDYK